MAVCNALDATTVLLPDCRLQLRRIWLDEEPRSSRCQGSGVRPWASRMPDGSRARRRAAVGSMGGVKHQTSWSEQAEEHSQFLPKQALTKLSTSWYAPS